MTTVTAIPAHLNGGPMDDQDIVVQGWEFKVAKRGRLSLAESDPNESLVAVTGRYTVRRDVNGFPVPHSLDSYSFDWQGWDQ